MRCSPLPRRLALAGAVLAAVAAGGGLAACDASEAGAPTPTTSATPSSDRPVPTLARGGTAVPVATTSTTTGPRPPGAGPAYPWQPAPRYDSDGSPSASWLAAARDLANQSAGTPGARIVFLGDSITEGWLSVGVSAWNAEWAPRRAIAEGIVGDTTSNLLWRIADGELTGLHPAAVVLLIGTNDYGAGWSAAQVARGIEACATAVRAALPEAALVLLTVLPRSDAAGSVAEEVRATNAALATAALPVDSTLLDMTATMADASGAPVPALFGPDLLHPSAQGYEVIAGRLLAVPALARQAPAGA